MLTDYKKSLHGKALSNIKMRWDLEYGDFCFWARHWGIKVLYF